MPSCVVKTCRNHSGSIKKNQGITFHRFPTANEVWRNDWINIIRECRNENNWNPSKSSVICSVHFEETDLYTTKGGLLRVVAYAVPKKLLQFDTSSIQEDQPAEVTSSNASNRSFLVIEVPSGSAQQIKLEQPLSQNVTSFIKQESPETVPPRVELEQPLPVLFSPRNRRLKHQLMKMRTLMQKQQHKIKILNQKVRRLQNRNKYLKDILKNLKEIGVMTDF